MADGQHRRRGRLHGAGDARPRARAPGPRPRRRRLRLARRASSAARSTLVSRGAAMPSFVTNDAALAHGADVTILCLSARGCGGDRAHRRRESSSTSRAHTVCATPQLRGLVRLHAPPARTGSPTGSTGCRSSSPGTGRLIANPGCYATATLLALAPLQDAIEPDSVVVDGLSGMTGAGRTLKAVDARRRGARERRRRTGSARTSTCPRSPSCSASRSPSPRISCRSVGVSSRRATSARRAPTCARCSRRRTPTARSSRSCPRGWRRSSRASSTPIGPRSASSSDRFTDRTIVDLRRGQPRQGRRRAGDPERQPRARARADAAGLRLGGVLV